MDVERRERIDHLIAAEDLDGLLAEVTLDEIAQAWCRNHAHPTDPDAEDEDPDWWAVEVFFMDALFKDTQMYREALKTLLRHADNEWLVGAVAAGPLENFVSDNEDDVRWIEREAKNDARPARALLGIAAHVSDATLLRLDAAAGSPLTRPLPRSEWSPELVEVDEAEQELRRLVGDDWTKLQLLENLDPASLDAAQRALERYLLATRRLAEGFGRE